MPINSAEDEILRLDEKIFEFSDEQSVAQKTEPDVSEQETQETSDDKKSPEYSAMPDDNKNTANNTEFNMTAQPRNASVFDFDDLNLLEIPPLEKKPLSAAEQVMTTEEIPENSDTKSVDEKKDSAEFGEKKDLPETVNFSPEVIEAIAEKLMEKLSDKVIKEIAQEITPQTVESVIEEMARKKTN
ncbi:MAG TPA: hypothetical protein VNI60_03595 [Pyrinomonadaceae bacterium]|nr:hypothetical protein [Pyrinomonadaceae bacterium]